MNRNYKILFLCLFSLSIQISFAAPEVKEGQPKDQGKKTNNTGVNNAERNNAIHAPDSLKTAEVSSPDSSKETSGKVNDTIAIKDSNDVNKSDVNAMVNKIKNATPDEMQDIIAKINEKFTASPEAQNIVKTIEDNVMEQVKDQAERLYKNDTKEARKELAQRAVDTLIFQLKDKQPEFKDLFNQRMNSRYEKESTAYESWIKNYKSKLEQLRISRKTENADTQFIDRQIEDIQNSSNRAHDGYQGLMKEYKKYTDAVKNMDKNAADISQELLNELYEIAEKEIMKIDITYNWLQRYINNIGVTVFGIILVGVTFGIALPSLINESIKEQPASSRNRYYKVEKKTLSPAITDSMQRQSPDSLEVSGEQPIDNKKATDDSNSLNSAPQSVKLFSQESSDQDGSSQSTIDTPAADLFSNAPTQENTDQNGSPLGNAVDNSENTTEAGKKKRTGLDGKLHYLSKLPNKLYKQGTNLMTSTLTQPTTEIVQ